MRRLLLLFSISGYILYLCKREDIVVERESSSLAVIEGGLTRSHIEKST